MSFERSYSIESHKRMKQILIFCNKNLLLLWWVTNINENNGLRIPSFRDCTARLTKSLAPRNPASHSRRSSPPSGFSVSNSWTLTSPCYEGSRDKRKRPSAVWQRSMPWRPATGQWTLDRWCLGFMPLCLMHVCMVFIDTIQCNIILILTLTDGPLGLCNTVWYNCIWSVVCIYATQLYMILALTNTAFGLCNTINYLVYGIHSYNTMQLYFDATVPMFRRAHTADHWWFRASVSGEWLAQCSCTAAILNEGRTCTVHTTAWPSGVLCQRV